MEGHLLSVAALGRSSAVIACERQTENGGLSESVPMPSPLEGL